MAEFNISGGPTSDELGRSLLQDAKAQSARRRQEQRGSTKDAIANLLLGVAGQYIGSTVTQNFNDRVNTFLNSENVHQNYFPPLSIVVVAPILLDMLKVIILRVVSFKLLFKPDRLHLHHNFLKIGLSERQTILQMYAIVFTSSSLSLLFIDFKYSNLMFSIIVLIFIIITFLNFRRKFIN